MTRLPLFSLMFVFLLLAVSGGSAQAQISFMIEPGSARLSLPDEEDGRYNPGSSMTLDYKVKMDAPFSILAFEDRHAYDLHREAFQNGDPSPVQLHYIFCLAKEGDRHKAATWDKRLLIVKRNNINDHVPRGSFDQGNEAPLETASVDFVAPGQSGVYNLYYCQTHIFSISDLTRAALLAKLKSKHRVFCNQKLLSFRVGKSTYDEEER